MTSHLTTLLSRQADRLAVRLETASTALVYGPPEFHVRDVAEATVARLDLTPVHRPLAQAMSDTSWREALAPSGVLLLSWDGSSEDLAPAWAAFEDATVGERLPLVIVVSESDAVPSPEVVPHFQTVLGPMSIAVHACDLVTLGKRWKDVALRHEVLRATAGSTDLVLAAVQEIESGGAAAASLFVGIAGQGGRGRSAVDGPLSLAARHWAQRLVVRLPQDDPLVLLHAMLPALTAEQVSAVATSVLHRTVGVEEVLAARRFPGIHRHPSHRDSFAPAVAAQVVRLTTERDPDSVLVLRRALADAALDPDLPLGSVERLAVLVGNGSWAALDEHLAGALSSVARLTRAQRRSLERILPGDVVTAWTYVQRCRELLSDPEITGHNLPTPWRELLWLLSASDARRLGVLETEVRDRLAGATSMIHSTVDSDLREAVADGDAFLTEHVARVHEAAARSRPLSPERADEAALLVLALIGESDGAVATGALNQAQRSLDQASSLLDVVGGDTEYLAAPRLGLAAREALLSSVNGVRACTEPLLAEYEDLVEELGARDPEPEHVALIARRFLTQTATSDVRSSAQIASNSAFTPLEVQAEAFVILLQLGPEVAAEWIRTFLSRSPFTDLSAVQWWPLHTTGAFLALRLGRPDAALATLERAYVPELAAVLVRAGASLLAGDLDEAEALIHRVVRDPDAPDRWRRLALGLRVTILARRKDPRLGDEVEVHHADWVEAPAMVALLPENGRRAVLPALDPKVAGLRGLRVHDLNRPDDGVVLTPRQTDVLEGLASDLTLAQIADQLFLGLETVRSTSKALYRRLGVHSREDAVRVARLSGLLPPEAAGALTDDADPPGDHGRSPLVTTADDPW